MTAHTTAKSETPQAAGTRREFAAVRRATWILLGGNTLAQVGIGFFFPILPLFIGRKGGTAVLVGIVTAIALIGAGATQYLGGSLSDRYGRRPVLVWSSAIYSAGFLAYLAPLPVEALIPVRFLHAGFGGLYLPASAALLSDLTPVAERGRAFGYLQSSNMIGLLIGPGIGGLVAGFRLELVFGAAALVCTLSTLLLLALPRVTAETAPVKTQVLPPPGLVRTLLPVIGMGAAYNYLFGAYDTIWSLFMVSAGATVFQVGLSFALFALPVALLSGTAGRLSDRFGARPTVAVTLSASGIFALGYVFVRNVPTLIGMGVVEGALTTGGQPALQAEVSRLAPEGQQGATQGIYRTAMVVAPDRRRAHRRLPLHDLAGLGVHQHGPGLRALSAGRPARPKDGGRVTLKKDRRVQPAVADLLLRLAGQLHLARAHEGATQRFVEGARGIGGQHPDQHRPVLELDQAFGDGAHQPATDAASLVLTKQVDGVELTEVDRVLVSLAPARGESDDVGAILGDEGVAVAGGQEPVPAAFMLADGEAVEVAVAEQAAVRGLPAQDVDCGDGSGVVRSGFADDRLRSHPSHLAFWPRREQLFFMGVPGGRSRRALILIAGSVLTLLAAGAAYVAPWGAAPAPAPPPPSVAPPGLQPVSAETAWLSLYSADQDNAFEVFKTLDGGGSWQRMLSVGSDHPLTWMHFFDARSGLVLAGTRGNQLVASILYVTTDGGAHWLQRPLPIERGLLDRPVLQWLAFADLQYGWYVAGIGNESAALYRTTDGGATWNEVARVDETKTSSHGLQLHGRKAGISFADRDEGWIGYQGPGPPSVYHSVNGGETWTLERLPQAPGALTEYRPLTVVSPPRVFGSYAVLVVAATANYALVSGDAGRSWSEPRLLPESRCCPSVLDPIHWWLSYGNDLWATADGGRHWQLDAARLPPGVTLVSVVPASVSRFWGLGSQNGVPGASVVLRSGDGGASWSVVRLPQL